MTNLFVYHVCGYLTAESVLQILQNMKRKKKVTEMKANQRKVSVCKI